MWLPALPTARLLPLLVAVVQGLACSDAAPGDSPAPTRPDVLLVTLDTLRADHLGIQGGPPDATPTMDALAERGVVFLRMLAASSRTAPSHASLFTSRWVRDHSIGYRNGSTRLGEEQTLAELLRDAGYETAAFVSNAMLRRRMGLDAGFELYDDELPDTESNRPVFERIAEKTTSRAVSWLRTRRTGPRFVWVQYNDAHGPYTPPESYVQEPGPWAPEDQWLPLLDQQRGIRGIPAYQAYADERDPRRYHARYVGEIRYLDARLGELIEAFEAQAAAPGAIIAVTADHGESMGEEDIWFSHGYATTPNLAHVPLLLVGDGLRPRRVDTPVHHVDLMPTLLELVDVEPPADAAGVALGPALRGEAPLPEDRPLYVDVGAELSVYRGDVFLRTRFGPDLGEAKRGSIAAYRWRDGSGWERIETPSSLRHLATDYSRERVPLLHADDPTPEQEQRLRALGYLEPKTEPEPGSEDAAE